MSDTPEINKMVYRFDRYTGTMGEGVFAHEDGLLYDRRQVDPAVNILCARIRELEEALRVMGVDPDTLAGEGE